mmetsp:Transcript_5455/g.13751  ORF Transcript_5455/g.13751 Transcript_5455/m.13751 type:complete len:283 (+) Transcript_5455:1171-2019(+)
MAMLPASSRLWKSSLILLLVVIVSSATAFCFNNRHSPTARSQEQQRRRKGQRSITTLHQQQQDAWNGDVVTNADGRIRGCSLTPVTSQQQGQDDNEQQQQLLMTTEWKLNIDGVEADLGRFSEAIYKKIMTDAKQQRFQGFRPGTIPPHLEPTYRAYAMDECARETVLEAMQQNNVRPFDSCRSDMVLEQFEIPPAKASKKKKKKKKSRKQMTAEGGQGNDDDNHEPVPAEPEVPQWRSFATMKEAISAGWKPGQSFSFVATNVRGQKLKPTEEPSTLNFAS